MMRNVLGPSTSAADIHEPPANVASKVAEVFLTAGHAFQRLGDLTLQLHSADDSEESKWAEADVDALRESLTKFAHELDTISERVQSRTMQVIKTDIKRRMVVPTEPMQRHNLQPIPSPSLPGLKRPAGGPIQVQPQMPAKRLLSSTTKPPGFSSAPISRMGGLGGGMYSTARQTYAAPRLLNTQVGSSVTISSHSSNGPPQRTVPNEQYYSSQGAYIQNG
ncbi:unnamed protein product, partial [Mesorhabditis spiculigera]